MRCCKTIFVLMLMLMALVNNMLWEFPGSVHAGTDISSSNAWGTWSAGKSPYYINDNLTIPLGETLIIEPGVKIITNGSYQIDVEGTLLANGTEANMIEFNGNDTGTGDYYWSGLMFSGNGTGYLQNCTIHNASSGIILNNSKFVTIKNCRITNNYVGIVIQNYSNNISIINCNISYNLYGCFMFQSNNNNITQCNITSNVYSGLELIDSYMNLINKVRVVENGIGIQLSGASHNNSIRYSDIRSNYNLGTGYSSGLVVLGNSKFISVSNTNVKSNHIQIWGIRNSNIVLDNCNIDNINLDNTDNVTLKNCNIRNSPDINLYCFWTSDVDIINCESYSNYYNIFVGWSKNINIIDCKISKFSDIGLSRGIYVANSRDLLIKSCDIISNKNFGISISNSFRNIIDDCLINNNSGSGILIDDSNETQILNSIISNNDVYGVSFSSSSYIKIKNCKLRENSNYGLHISSCDNISIFDSKISENLKSGIYNSNSDHISVSNSEIIDNNGEGIEISSGNMYLETCTLSNFGYEAEISSDATIYFIDCDYDSEFLVTSYSGKYYVGWFLDVIVKTLSDTPVHNAVVRVVGENNPPFNDTVYRTDSSGKVSKIICYEFLQDYHAIINYNPYSLIIHKQKVGVFQKNLNITRSTDITILLEQVDLIPTKLSYSWPMGYVPVNKIFNISLEIENTAESYFYDIVITTNITGVDKFNSFKTIINVIPPNTKIKKEFEHPPISSVGDYDVTLTIDSDNQVLEINEVNNLISSKLTISERPVAILNANRTSVWVEEPIFFSGEKSYGSYAILEYIFDFGDGSKQTLKSTNKIEHKFENSGFYMVNLTVVDIHSISSFQDTVFVEVLQRPDKPNVTIDLPIANFTITPGTGDIKTSFTFDPISSTPSPGALIESYNWFFGDGSTSIWKKPIHFYDDDGIYIVSLVVKDTMGKSSPMFNQTLVVKNIKPVVILKVETDIVKTNEPVLFNGSQTYDIDDSLFEPGARFTWFFGDVLDSNYTESSINYPDGKFDMVTEFIYNEPGEYNVTLIVVDDDETRNQTTVKIRVIAKDSPANGNVSTSKDENYLIIVGISSLIIIIIICILFLFMYRRKNRALSQKDKDTGSDSTKQDADSTTPALGEIAPTELEEDSLTPDIMSQVIAAKKRSGDELSTESTTKPKPQKEIKKKITRRNHVNTYQPPEVEITLPDEKVVDWKDQEHANGHVLSLKEVAVVSDQDLLDASMIGINGKNEEEFVTEDYVEPEEYEEPKDYISPELEPVLEQEDIDGVEWMSTPDTDTEDEIVVFEFEEDGETKSQELEVTLEETAATSVEKPRPKPKTSGKHKKERLIPIPGIGFVTRAELQKALGMTDEDGLEDFDYEDIPIPYGVPLKMDDSIDSNSNLHCKWCDKPIKGKYIKVRRKELDGTKLAIVGPFCSPECAAKFGK